MVDKDKEKKCEIYAHPDCVFEYCPTPTDCSPECICNLIKLGLINDANQYDEEQG